MQHVQTCAEMAGEVHGGLSGVLATSEKSVGNKISRIAMVMVMRTV